MVSAARPLRSGSAPARGPARVGRRTGRRLSVSDMNAPDGYWLYTNDAARGRGFGM